MKGKEDYISGLNLLRVFAVICVIACHTGLLDSMSGGVGNKIFFVMGGFLAFFSLGQGEPVGIKGVGKYYFKKIVRIVPSLWLTILIAWRLFPGIFSLRNLDTENSLILNLFLVKSWGHLWFMQQIMLMYLLSPLFFIVLRLINGAISNLAGKYTGNIACALFLFVMAFLEKRYFTADILRLSGEGSHKQFQVWMYFIGIAFAYLAVAFKDRKKKMINRYVTDGVVIIFIALILYTALWSVSDRGGLLVTIMHDEVIRSVISGICMMLFYNAKDSLMGTVSEFLPVRIIGEDSYDIYLVHFFLLGPFSGLPVLKRFLYIFAISVLWGRILFVLRSAPKWLGKKKKLL